MGEGERARAAEKRKRGKAREKGHKAPLGEEDLSEKRADVSGLGLLRLSVARGS
jgi:hypothetical protein